MNIKRKVWTKNGKLLYLAHHIPVNKVLGTIIPNIKIRVSENISLFLLQDIIKVDTILISPRMKIPLNIMPHPEIRQSHHADIIISLMVNVKGILKFKVSTSIELVLG